MREKLVLTSHSTRRAGVAEGINDGSIPLKHSDKDSWYSEWKNHVMNSIIGCTCAFSLCIAKCLSLIGSKIAISREDYSAPSGSVHSNSWWFSCLSILPSSYYWHFYLSKKNKSGISKDIPVNFVLGLGSRKRRELMSHIHLNFHWIQIFQWKKKINP